MPVAWLYMNCRGGVEMEKDYICFKGGVVINKNDISKCDLQCLNLFRPNNLHNTYCSEFYYEIVGKEHFCEVIINMNRCSQCKEKYK
jgi:hypothetical protein